MESTTPPSKGWVDRTQVSSTTMTAPSFQFTVTLRDKRDGWVGEYVVSAQSRDEAQAEAREMHPHGDVQILRVRGGERIAPTPTPRWESTRSLRARAEGTGREEEWPLLNYEQIDQNEMRVLHNELHQLKHNWIKTCTRSLKS